MSKVLAGNARGGRRGALASVRYATPVRIEVSSVSGMLATASLELQISGISSTKPLGRFGTSTHSLRPCAIALIKCRACSLQSYASVHRSVILSLESASTHLLRTHVPCMQRMECPIYSRPRPCCAFSRPLQKGVWPRNLQVPSSSCLWNRKEVPFDSQILGLEHEKTLWPCYGHFNLLNGRHCVRKDLSDSWTLCTRRNIRYVQKTILIYHHSATGL